MIETCNGITTDDNSVNRTDRKQLEKSNEIKFRGRIGSDESIKTSKN